MTTELTPYFVCDGAQMKYLAEAGLNWLNQNHRYVNELNVFPVPDGDTGTNMLLTMRNAYSEIKDETSSHVGRILDKLAHGAMMGSRGNSGTILSQLWIGLARTLHKQETFNAYEIVKALRTATDTAYRGVQRPVEGTILTVAREITEFCEQWLPIIVDTNDNHKTIEPETGLDLIILLEKIVQVGWEAVKKTPELLPVLKKAGVVDSGGTGLMYVLEGMLRYVRGDSVEAPETAELAEQVFGTNAHGSIVEMPNENIYDVQFVIKGDNLSLSPVKNAIEQMGDSAVIVGSETAIKVHVHVQNPGIPLQYAANVGLLSDVVVENMLEQYYDYLAKQHADEKEAPFESLELREIEPNEIAVIAIASGFGMAQVFQQLDVAGLVEGGQTNNPSTQEILDVIEKVNTDKVIVLPNNKNIILTAEQAATMSNKQVRIVPTRTFPQGVSAMLPYQPDGNLDTIAEAMNETKDQVITGEITTATRSVDLDIEVKEGQFIGLLNGNLNVAGEDLNTVVQDLIQSVEALADMELVTLYYGQDITAAMASALLRQLAGAFPTLEFEAVYGGQPHYHYIFSIE